jgi:hypothetical protein
MQDLYHIEINASVSWFWGRRLRGEARGRDDRLRRRNHRPALGEVESWLRDQAITHSGGLAIAVHTGEETVG